MSFNFYLFIVLTNVKDERVPDEREKNNQQRKSKYYAPLYTVRERVSGTNPPPLPSGEQRKKREPKSSRERHGGPNEGVRVREKPPRQARHFTYTLFLVSFFPFFHLIFSIEA